ncbi:MAG: tellurite resistance/C4-dicarboxylate transporter family protein [Bacteroidetes bacterium]|nr:tellurite resistance/C4-dicarboxylate transporter family protein [Bacteroidota bacterium]
MISSTVQQNFKEAVGNLSPAYFALVMATGIVSTALFLFHFIEFSFALFYFNIAAYIFLLFLYALRIIYFTEQIQEDFADLAKSPGFLTFVAATNVLGVQFVLLQQNFFIASWLLLAGMLSWGFLIYSFFVLIIIKESKPPLEKVISGIWLLIVVSTQSVSVLLTQVTPYLPFPESVTLFVSLNFFFCGCLFYILIITFIFYRLVFFTVQAEQFAPPYWINMGAVAITTLAGSLLMLHETSWSFLNSLSVFLKGSTLFFWAVGTWWIPLVFILGIWRHGYKKIPFTYQPQYWGMVFPLGMYSVCTYRLSQAIDIPFIEPLALFFLYPAVLMWGVVFLGMLRQSILLFTRKSA